MANLNPGFQENWVDETTKAMAPSVVAKLSTDLGIPGINTVLTQKADKASPALTGTPTAPTADPGTNTTQIATTAFVAAAATTATVADATTTTKGKVALAGDLAGTADAPTVPGLATKADTSALAAKANIASPTFTGTVGGVTAAMVGALATSTRGAVSGVASLDAAQHHLYAEMPVGGTIRVQYATGSFRDMAGNAITARPTARTDLVVVARAPAGTTAPTWLIDSDEYATY